MPTRRRNKESPIILYYVCDDDLEHANQPVAFQPHDVSFVADLNRANGTQALPVGIDLPILFTEIPSIEQSFLLAMSRYLLILHGRFFRLIVECLS